MRNRLLTLCICLLLTSASAAAADKGWVIGIGLGSTSVDGTAHAPVIRTIGLPQSISINGLAFDSNDTSLSADLGYNLNRYVGIGLGYASFGDFSGGRLLNGTYSLSADAWTLGARFRYPLVRSLEAQWYAGAARFQFDMDGRVLVAGFPFPPIPSQELPFASPGDRTGYHWGFGFGWQINPHLGTNAGYRKYKSSVIDFESATLGMEWSF